MLKINFTVNYELSCTVKPVYNDHHWDPKIAVVVDRWSLFGGGR